MAFVYLSHHDSWVERGNEGNKDCLKMIEPSHPRTTTDLDGVEILWLYEFFIKHL